MATGGVDLIALLSEDILSCEICQEEFDTHTRPPQILPCYHSYCGICINNLSKDGRLKCPKCRVEIAADERFPMDTTRVALMDLKRSVQSQEGVACEGCPVGGKATSRCQECAEYFCKDCTSAHRRFKMSRHHHVISLSEAAKSPEKLVQTSEKCDRHADKNLELFCVTCSKAVCSICALTLHLEGHKFVELESALDDQKKKVLSLCEQLDQAQRKFQKKVEESKASLEALDSSHKEAATSVQKTFSSIISSAMERQAEALAELTAKVKSDRLLLEEQLANFQSLLAASQTAADYGRRMVSLSLASEILKQNAELEKSAGELKKKLTAAVVPAPTYQVVTEKLEEVKSLVKALGKIESGTVAAAVSTGVKDLPVMKALGKIESGTVAAAVSTGVKDLPVMKALGKIESGTVAAAVSTGVKDLPVMKALGKIESGTVAAAAVSTGVEGLPVCFPVIRLDGSRCHRDCSVGDEGCSLSNQPQSKVFEWRGTCGTVALPGQTCYWQVRCQTTRSHEIAVGRYLCEVGVASLKDLQAAGMWINASGLSVLTAALYPSGDSVRARVCQSGEILSDTKLAPFNPHKPVECTLGFLLVAPTKRLVVIDVDTTQVLCDRQVDMSQPLRPCVSVKNAASVTHASVRLVVQSGHLVTLTPALVSLMRTLVG